MISSRSLTLNWLKATSGCAYKLSMNISKTAFSIILNTAENYIQKVNLRNEEIKYVSNFKFLGITIDDRINFSNSLTLSNDRFKNTRKIISVFNIAIHGR